MRAKLLAAVALSMLLIGAAIAGYKCSTFCGSFAGCAARRVGKGAKNY